MNKENLEKMVFETPNDFELGGKIREIVTDKQETETETSEPDWKEMYLRLSAEFDNFRKRAAKEKEDLVIKTKASFIEPILDLDNDLAIASKFSKDNEGLNLIMSKMDKFLQSQGIETIQTEEYDENLHEVIAVKHNHNVISDVVSKGYKIGDKVIRYAKVIL